MLPCHLPSQPLSETYPKAFDLIFPGLSQKGSQQGSSGETASEEGLGEGRQRKLNYYILFKKMFRRHRNLPASHPQPSPDSKFTEQPALSRPPLHSPQHIFTRYQRKPAEQTVPKCSSLNNKLRMKSPQGQCEPSQAATQSNSNNSNPIGINNDYYPEQNRRRGEQRSPKAQFLTQVDIQQPQRNIEREILAFQSENQFSSSLSDQQIKIEQESVSTEMSKQQLKNSLKEVKFGGVIKETRENIFMKKKEKGRSPSILKNARNILGDLTSADKSRSCSVASGKQRRGDRQKYKNEHNMNSIIKQKYKSILNKLQAEYHGKSYKGHNRFSAATYSNSERTQIPSPYKYKDDLFPPVYSSLFSLKKSRPKPGTEIKWMRIGNLFPDKHQVLAKPASTDIEIFKGDDSYSQDYLPGTLNCLLGSHQLIQRMFEDQTINSFGIYLVKIYQENVWKYIIIDDYIPVRKGESGKMEPAFIDVRVPKDAPLDIWPFLLEKAYANYYSSYEALHYGNMLDFAEEITGTPSERVKIKGESYRKGDKMTQEESENAIRKVEKTLKKGNTIAVGQIAGDKGYAPLVFSAERGELFWHDPFCQFKQRKLNFHNLKQTFRAVHLISPLKYAQCTTSPLKKTKQTSKKCKLPLLEPEYPSIRTFTVENAGEYAISIKQREKRLFHFKEHLGEYIWVRAILLQKQYEDTGFRWIDGQYTKKKTICFSHYLEPGQYWVVIEPEWQSSVANQLLLNLYGPSECQLGREVYNPQSRIIERGCLDLAQRYGQLNQINKFICSYNYITEAVGLIIENIVNERVTGNVSVIRSIRGLKCNSLILPVNCQFYETVSSKEGDLLKLTEQIELDIPEGENYTVVLKLKGGIDSKFFRTFDFGC